MIHIPTRSIALHILRNIWFTMFPLLRLTTYAIPSTHTNFVPVDELVYGPRYIILPMCNSLLRVYCIWIKRDHRKHEELSRERHKKSTRKLSWYFRHSRRSFSTRRNNLCQHIVKMAPRAVCYIYYLFLIEKDLWECRNISQVYVCSFFVIWRPLHFFFGKSFPFLKLIFCVIRTSVLFLSM